MNFLKTFLIIFFLASFVFAKPVADFTFNPVSGDAPLKVYFDASSSIDAVRYVWNVDGVDFLSNEYLETIFQAGEHVVNLTVIDDEGETDSVSKSFTLTDNGKVYTGLTVYPAVYDDETGLYKFSASASENGFCEDTNVFINFNGGSYKLDKGVDCSFSRYLKLPAGDYNIDFKAVYSDSERNAFYKLTVASGEPAFIKVYSPQENTSFKKDAVAYVEAVFVYGVKNIRSGVGLVKLVNASGSVLNQQDLVLYYPGAFKGFIPLNVSAGNYSLVVEIKYNGFDLIKQVPVVVSENQSENSISVGPSIYLVEPGVFNYSLNSSVSFEINFFDEKGMLISDADALMKITRYNESIAEINMTKGRFSYDSFYFFNESGDYIITFELQKGDEKATKTVALVVGNSTQLANVENFTVSILSPLPEVYVENSSLNLRALVKYGNERVGNATVTAFLNDEEINMDYDNYGEYVYSTPLLSSGNYDFKVVADYLDLKAVSEMNFEVSPHVLALVPFEPDENESIELNKSKGITLKVDLVDEQNHTVPDALIKGEIVEPSGRTIKVSFVQNQDTKAYEAVFYPNDEGIYSVNLKGYEQGFVHAEASMSFKVKFYKQKVELPEFSTEALLIIVLAIAILVLIVALLKLIF